MNLAARLAALEAAQAAVLNTANRLAVLNSLLRELELPPASCPALGVVYHQLDEAVFAAECEAHRRAALERVTA